MVPENDTFPLIEEVHFISTTCPPDMEFSSYWQIFTFIGKFSNQLYIFPPNWHIFFKPARVSILFSKFPPQFESFPSQLADLSLLNCLKPTLLQVGSL